jgi:hypothetical protein
MTPIELMWQEGHGGGPTLRDADSCNVTTSKRSGQLTH